MIHALLILAFLPLYPGHPMAGAQALQRPAQAFGLDGVPAPPHLPVPASVPLALHGGEMHSETLLPISSVTPTPALILPSSNPALAVPDPPPQRMIPVRVVERRSSNAGSNAQVSITKALVASPRSFSTSVKSIIADSCSRLLSIEVVKRLLIIIAPKKWLETIPQPTIRTISVSVPLPAFLPQVAFDLELPTPALDRSPVPQGSTRAPVISYLYGLSQRIGTVASRSKYVSIVDTPTSVAPISSFVRISLGITERLSRSVPFKAGSRSQVSTTTPLVTVVSISTSVKSIFINSLSRLSSFRVVNYILHVIAPKWLEKVSQPTTRTITLCFPFPTFLPQISFDLELPTRNLVRLSPTLARTATSSHLLKLVNRVGNILSTKLVSIADTSTTMASSSYFVRLSLDIRFPSPVLVPPPSHVVGTPAPAVTAYCLDLLAHCIGSVASWSKVISSNFAFGRWEESSPMSAPMPTSVAATAVPVVQASKNRDVSSKVRAYEFKPETAVHLNTDNYRFNWTEEPEDPRITNSPFYVVVLDRPKDAVLSAWFEPWSLLPSLSFEHSTLLESYVQAVLYHHLTEGNSCRPHSRIAYGVYEVLLLAPSVLRLVQSIPYSMLTSSFTLVLDHMDMRVFCVLVPLGSFVASVLWILSKSRKTCRRPKRVVQQSSTLQQDTSPQSNSEQNRSQKGVAPTKVTPPTASASSSKSRRGKRSRRAC